MSISQFRESQHDVDPLFISRWSSRAMTGEDLPDAVLFSGFEAARWAPSGGNTQPWRFIYTKRNAEDWPRFLGLVHERNRVWAANASALILLLSQKVRNTDQGPIPLRYHSFDSGAAWSNFSHQVSLLGWNTRAIGGFDRDAARTLLSVPDDYELEIIIAIGKSADKAVLPDDLQSKEQPTGRLPLLNIVASGGFAFSA